MNGSASPETPTVRVKARPSASQIVGDLLLTAGILLALFVVYEAFWTDLASGRLQDEAAARLDHRWSSPPAASDDPARLPVPALGEAFARIHLPALGDDAVYTILEGTRNEDLRTGPGHYPGTQMPGEPGNVALAGHRNGSGAVFQHLDRLDSCDAVVLETETQWLTYRLVPVETDDSARRTAAARCLDPEQAERITTGDYSHVQGLHITTPQAVEVIDPIPGAWQDGQNEQIEPDGQGGAFGEAGEADTAPTTSLPLERMLTLTTCHPQFSNAERMIVHAVLVETTSKAGVHLPAALTEE